MSVRINHNRAAINAHRNLLANQTALRGSLEKLSSGIAVNRASDGPASLVISEQLRAQVKSLNQAVTNSEQAISLVQTTEGALNEVNRLLVNMRQLSIHAANEGANDEIMLQADQLEIDNALQTIDRISSQTQFGNKLLLDGSNGVAGIGIGEGVEFLGASVNTQSSTGSGYDLEITKNASKASVRGTAALTEDIVQAGETFTVIEGGKTVSFTTSESDTVDTAAQRLSSAVKDAGLNVAVMKDEAGTLTVTHNDYGSESEFQVSSTTEGVLSKAAGSIDTIKNGDDIAGRINGESAQGKGQILTGSKGAANIDGLKIGYWGTANDGGEIPKEGVSVGNVSVTQNSLKFQIGGNRNQTAAISLFNTSSLNLAKGVNNDSDFSRLRDISVTSAEGAQDSLLLIDSAINEITSIRGELGAFQKNTLEGNLSNLRIASENLVAAESTVRDVDMASEMANFTRNQIMTESSTAMLAHANNMPNSILKLLG